MVDNEARDSILGDGAKAAWWFLADVTKAHMVVDLRGGPGMSRTVVKTRCGLEFWGHRLDRRWIGGHDIRQDKCRLCSFDLDRKQEG